MASQKLIHHFNVRQSFFLSEPSQPLLDEPCNNNSAQVPEPHRKAFHDTRVNLEGVRDRFQTLPTSARDSIFEDLDGWDNDCGVGELPSPGFYPADEWTQDQALVEWGTLLPELESRGQTSDTTPAIGAEVIVSERRTGNGFQSTVDSLQKPISANPGQENFHSYLHSSLGPEESLSALEEIDPSNVSERNATSFEQSPANLFLVDEPSAMAPFNGYSDSRWLQHGIENRQANILFPPSRYQDSTSSLSNSVIHSKNFVFPCNQSIDYGSQLDFFDGPFAVLPPRPFETTFETHAAAVSLSALDSQSASLCLNESSHISTGNYNEENTSVIPRDSALLSNVLQYDTSHNSESLEALANHHSPGEIMSENENKLGISSKTTGKGGLLSEPMNWQHISSTELKPHEVIRDVKQKRKYGRRHGRLKPETAKHAREMRHLRACLPCAIMKMSCSPGDICKRCSALSPQSLGKRICTRAHLEDFNDLLFPVLFVSHLRHNSVDQLSSELNLGFVGVDIEVSLTCGSGYLPLNLAVSEFAPKSNQVIRVPTISTRSTNSQPLFEYRYPPPIAFRSSCVDLVEICRKHIKLVAKQERNLLGLITDWGHKIRRLTLKAIIRYHKTIRSSRTTAILDKALMLYTIYIYMATTLTITESSKTHLSDHIRKPTRIDYDSNIASRLLNRQIKSAMHDLRQQLMREVLEELERELKTRSKAVWAPCFCVALILCMCVEEAQIAMDAFAMHTQVLGEKQDAPSSPATIDSCRKLDDLLFGHLLELFHGVYKTHQTSKGLNSSRVYNPMRDGPQIDIKEGLDQEAANLVLEFLQIMADYKTEIVERAATPSFGDNHDSLARHMVFREQNSARLVSSFLKSFYSS